MGKISTCYYNFAAGFVDLGEVDFEFVTQRFEDAGVECGAVVAVKFVRLDVFVVEQCAFAWATAHVYC